MSRETIGQTDIRLARNTQRSKMNRAHSAPTGERSTVSNRKLVHGTDNKYPSKKS